MSAIGKVVALDAEPLFDADHKYAGKVVITITVDEAHAMAWRELWGRDVQALPIIQPHSEQASLKGPKQP